MRENEGEKKHSRSNTTDALVHLIFVEELKEKQRKEQRESERYREKEEEEN